VGAGRMYETEIINNENLLRIFGSRKKRDGRWRIETND